MAFLYAAPFLLTAAITFFVSISWPAARPHALVAPTGVLAFGAGLLPCYLLPALVAHHVGYAQPATWLMALTSLAGGFAVSLVGALAFRSLLLVLPRWLIRCGLVSACLCSAGVLWIGSEAVYPVASTRRISALFEGGAAIAISCWLLKHPEQFRPHPYRLPWLCRIR